MQQKKNKVGTTKPVT